MEPKNSIDIVTKNRLTMQSNKQVDGFAKLAYMNNNYYEAIYRALFHTARILNYNIIVEQNLLSKRTIHFIASMTFS